MYVEINNNAVFFRLLRRSSGTNPKKGVHFAIDYFQKLGADVVIGPVHAPGKYIIIYYMHLLDLSAAFDTIDHNTLTTTTLYRID